LETFKRKDKSFQHKKCEKANMAHVWTLTQEEGSDVKFLLLFRKVLTSSSDKILRKFIYIILAALRATRNPDCSILTGTWKIYKTTQFRFSA